MEDTTLGWRFVNPRMQAGLPADLARRDRRVRRGPVDRQPRAPGRVRAREPAPGRGRDRGGPVRRPARAGRGHRAARAPSTVVDRDEHPRPTPPPRRSPGSSPRSRPAGPSPRATAPGSTTAPRRCCSSRRTRARELGLRPMARVVVDGGRRRPPRRHGHRARARRAQGAGPGGPRGRRPRRRRDQRGVRVSQSVACMDELGLDPARVNPNGGAIALGHPLGCVRRAAGDDAGPRARPDRRPLRPRDDVHRRGAGDRHGRGARRRADGQDDRRSPGRGFAGCWTKSVALRTIGVFAPGGCDSDPKETLMIEVTDSKPSRRSSP